MVHNADYLYQLLRQEILQLQEEGRLVEPDFHRKLEEARGDKKRLWALYEEASSWTPRSDFPYEEPSTWEGIKEAMKGNVEEVFRSPHITPSSLRDKIFGAWLGRCAGCMLGKPVEGWDSERLKENLSRIGEYPLSFYFPLEFFPAETRERVFNLTREGIQRGERDDDTDYTILNLHIIETYGANFRTQDVGNEWLDHFPYHLVYTAEREAYRNLVNGMEPPQTAIFLNPFREWIGAQIRADLWGYVAPGRPGVAVEFAFRDASLSHTKNGIYGEMLFSALISLVLGGKDIKEGIEIASSFIPQRSRLREAVDDALRWYEEDGDWEESLRKAKAKYGVYHPVHTINNAVVVLLALLYGEGDFGRTVCLSVMGGWDTDCNGATAGSVVGAFLGAKDLPSHWVEPLNDTLLSVLIGFNENRISDLAKRTFAVALFLDQQRGI